MAHRLPARSRHHECAVCMERFTSPRLLPCFHTFCLGCLKQLAQKHGGSFPCPTCRTTTKVPAGGVEKFQVNFYIEAEVESQHPTPAKKRTCEMCGKEPATHKCSDCEQLACDACTQIHASIKATRSHTVLNLQQAAAGQPALTVSKERFCKTHQDEKIRFFCTQCSAVICRDCKLTSHEGHASTDLAEKSAEAKSLILQVTDRACNNLEPKLRAALQSATERKVEVQNSKKDIERTLEQRAEELKREIDQSLANAKQKLNQEVVDVDRLVTQSIGSMTQELTCFISFTEHARRVADSGCDADILEIPNEMEQFFGVATDTAQFASYPPCPHYPAYRAYPTYPATQKKQAKLKGKSGTLESCESPGKLKSFTSKDWDTGIQLGTDNQAWCSSCSYKIDKDSPFCVSCGVRNLPAATNSPGYRHIKCQHCLMKYSSKYGSCTNCGTQNPGSSSTPLTTIKTAIPQFIGQVTRWSPASHRNADVSRPRLRGRQLNTTANDCCSEITSEISCIQSLLFGSGRSIEGSNVLPPSIGQSSQLGYRVRSWEEEGDKEDTTTPETLYNTEECYEDFLEFRPEEFESF